jgi:23S rRNA-intervening sequence protein
MPTSKHQRSSKSQASLSKDGNRILKYPKISNEVLLLNDAQVGSTSERHAFDLEEGTALFGEAIIRFVKKIPRVPENDWLIRQIVGCGTSIGANYCEANEAVSKKDFKCIIGRCVKEAKETNFFFA